MNESEPQVIETPVTACGGKINDPLKYPAANHKGKTIYFCTDACLQAFQADPHGFMAGEVKHPE